MRDREREIIYLIFLIYISLYTQTIELEIDAHFSTIRLNTCYQENYTFTGIPPAFPGMQCILAAVTVCMFHQDGA